MSNEEIIQFISDIASKTDPESGATIPDSLYEDTRLINSLRDLVFTINEVVSKSNKGVVVRYHDKRQQLIEFRRNRAKEDNISAFCVFDNKCLDALLAANIQKKSDLLNVYGIGEGRYKKYGDAIFDILTRNSDDEPEPLQVKCDQEYDPELEELRKDMIEMQQKEAGDLDVDSCKNCSKRKSGNCSQVRNQLCEDYERRVEFTPDEIRDGYHGGNMGDASRFRQTGHWK